MKIKISKIIFIISFLPYLFILFYGIITSFTGISFFFNTSYGINAFIATVLLTLYVLTLSIPIIPICIIYQICYIFRKKFKNIEFRKYVKVCFTIGTLIIISIIIYSYSFEIEYFIEKINAKKMIYNSEEKIGFNKNKTIANGIFNLQEYKYNHILIDYDYMEIGMLLNSSVDHFWKIKLKKTTTDSSIYKHIIDDYYMQADISLKTPGKRLISFYENESLIHRTIAFLLICDDETVYFADNIKEKDTGFTRFTGLQWSEFFVGENVKFLE